jgi:hypothetical protein
LSVVYFSWTSRDSSRPTAVDALQAAEGHRDGIARFYRDEARENGSGRGGVDLTIDHREAADIGGVTRCRVAIII